jgi:ACS family allantoate permease-like MFS transporter
MVLSIGVRIDQGILLSMINCWVSVVTIFVMWYGTRIHKRSIISALPHLISIAGAIMVLEVPKSQSKVRLAGFYLSLVYAVAGTACMSFISSNIAGRTKKSSVAAMYFIVSQVGNLIGPQTFQAKDAKNGYRPALITVVTCNCITFIAMIVLYFYLDRTNKHRDKLAETDQSAVADLHAFGENEVTVLDMTDRQNKHFRYAT